MTFTSKRFEVRTNPWAGIGEPNLSNLSDLYRPGDEDRLKWMYTQYGPSASFDPNTRQFFPNYGKGGNLGQYGAAPNYGQGEIDSAPGDTFIENVGIGGQQVSDPFQIPIPRISPIDESQFGGGSNGCPSGFYQFGKVCVPDTSLNPSSPGSELGSGGLFGTQYYGKGGPKGVITSITPPQFTQANQEFIVLTDMQNIGGEPAKFYTIISIPQINISGAMSNSTLVNPLSKMKIGQRVIMPTNVPTNTLLQATVQLAKIPISNTGVQNTSTIIDDNGSVNIPTPGYRGPLPPAGGNIAGTIGAGQGLYPGPPPIFPMPPQQPRPMPYFGPFPQPPRMYGSYYVRTPNGLISIRS